eukprot:TRINITY_DN4129_c0_g3_i1.p1 TRINITY_DN4129_c0_g3~~TRINITY_DN4129_c0_g3_i1.p1  ORF type:complete len:671 (+),score=131.67 TRINITY_DN4129_c0_g3_i1:104-2014(+)
MEDAFDALIAAAAAAAAPQEDEHEFDAPKLPPPPPPPPPPELTPSTGLIKSYSERHGYGFICSPTLDGEARFSSEELPSNAPPGISCIGSIVRFQPKDMGHGRWRVHWMEFVKENEEEPPERAPPPVVTLPASAPPPQVRILPVRQAAPSRAPPPPPAPPPPAPMPGQAKAAPTTIRPPVLAPIRPASALPIPLQSVPSTPMLTTLRQGPAPPQVIPAFRQPEASQLGQPRSLRGTIKSHSTRNGYGFITAPGIDGEVRFTTADIPQVEPWRNLTGQAVDFEPKVMPDGKYRVLWMELATPPTPKTVPASSVLASRVPAPAAPQSTAHVAQRLAALITRPAFSGKPSSPILPVAQTPQTIKPVSWVAKDTRGAVAQTATTATWDGSAAASTGTPLAGIVKSYSDRHGYGFINIAGDPTDIKFGKYDMIGSRPVGRGDAVHFFATVGRDDRVKAEQVCLLEEASTIANSRKRAADVLPPPAPPAKILKPQDVKAGETYTGERMTGVVKCDHNLRGFGFITDTGEPNDVFFLKYTVPDELRDTDLTGRTVNFEVVMTAEGKMRAHDMQIEAVDGEAEAMADGEVDMSAECDAELDAIAFLSEEADVPFEDVDDQAEPFPEEAEPFPEEAEPFPEEEAW